MIRRQAEKSAPRLTRRTEKRLIAQISKGCEASARELVEAHQDRLFAFVWRVLRNREDAEEVCQEAFLRAFGSLDSFSPEYRFSTWLFTIAYRLCLNLIRRRRALTGELDFAELPSRDQDVSDRFAESEEARRLKDKIWEAVDRLSVPQRAAVLLFYREGMSCDQIARTLSIPMATAKSHLHRARGKLRDSLSGLVEDWSHLEALREAAS